jgi:1-acyl-sn-glycerol-3-phosphate acyltransferase
MLKPKKNLFIKILIEKYVSIILNRNFNSIEIISEITKSLNPQNSILLVGNHFSWWDGFFAWHLNKVLFNKDFYIMIKEEQLKKIPLFRYTGGFSINPGSRSIIKSLTYSSELLNNKNSIVTIFPQGELNSVYTTQINWKKGIERIAKNINNVNIIMYAAFIDYFDKKKPTVYIYMKLSEEKTMIKEEYNSFYFMCKQQQQLIKC